MGTALAKQQRRRTDLLNDLDRLLVERYEHVAAEFVAQMSDDPIGEIAPTI